MIEEIKLGFSEELERDIVALCIHDPQFFLDVHEYLKPSHLASPAISKAYTVVKTYFDHHHTIPKESIILHLLGKLDVSLPADYFKKEVLNKEFLLKETVDLIRHQEMKKFIYSALTEVDKKTPNFDQLETQLREVINIQPTQNLGTFYFDLDERFAKLQSITTDRTPTGIPSIDRALGGGLGRKELTCVAAPPGAGKSYLLCIAGAHILTKQRKNIVHYTFEMSEEITSLRYDSAILNLSSKDILGDVESAKERLLRYSKIMKENLVIKEFPTKGASVNTIRAHLNKLKEQRNFIPDGIIVDYGDIMKSTKSYQNRYEEQGSIFQDLRGLGQELDIWVMSATQTNRGSMSKDIVTMEDLGDSFDKARIMDALFIILQKPEEKEDGLLRLYDAKVRHGKSGTITGYEINYENAQLRELGSVEEED